MSIFKAAYNLDFEAIREYLENGGEINICNENGSSLLACYILRYLDEADPPSEAEQQLLDAHPENEYEFWDFYVYERQKTPLEKRSSGIFNQLELLFSYGADPNLCKIVDEATETALMHAVCMRDYYLTEYLLKKGADPGVRLFTPHEWDEADKEYWLMDELDIDIMNGDRGELAELDLSIAQLLWEHGLKDWGGYCIDIDKEKGVIGGHPLRVKY